MPEGKLRLGCSGDREHEELSLRPYSTFSSFLEGTDGHDGTKMILQV